MLEKPNVLHIMTDQQRADTLGVYGSELAATPNIDALAASGVTFGRAYCNNPLCMPSRATVLTGRYPCCSGVRTNGCVASAGQRVLPELLSEAGYQTAAFGKVHYHPAESEPQGYWPENRKVTWYAGEDYGEIYDLEEDPNEFVNLWDRCDRGVKQQLIERLLDAVVRNQDVLPPKLSHA